MEREAKPEVVEVRESRDHVPTEAVREVSPFLLVGVKAILRGVLLSTSAST